MSQDRNDFLFREEVRGIFVIGVIATFLGLVQFGPDIVFIATPRVGLHDFELVFSSEWGLYVVFAAIAVSDDWVSPRLIPLCHGAAKMFFHLGVGLLLATFVIILVNYSFGTSVAIGAGIITVFVSAVGLEATSPKPTKKPR